MKVFAFAALFASLVIAAPIQGNHEPLSSELSLDTPHSLDIGDWISKIKEWIQDHKDELKSDLFDEASESNEHGHHGHHGHHGGDWGHRHHDWQSFLSEMESLSGLDEEFSHPHFSHSKPEHPSEYHSDWHGGKPSDLPSGTPSDLPSGTPSDLPGGKPTDLPGSKPSDLPDEESSEASESSESGTSEEVYSTLDISVLDDLLD
ncbi:hypothetical protein IWW36_002797 [Coemansia brasiliensis]|uniref:Uncharacterized protein n=1 Tax=Coemansia brasiliensis TaxID=2650707 RepID=A0A9W8I6K8_9FUNG|nr:hypothetical protein IWW36_002797 [Coemansia brasiliensis]